MSLFHCQETRFSSHPLFFEASIQSKQLLRSYNLLEGQTLQNHILRQSGSCFHKSPQSSWRNRDLNKLHGYFPDCVTMAKIVKFHNPSLKYKMTIILNLDNGVRSMKEYVYINHE